MSADSTVDFNAVLLNPEYIKELNVLLIPNNPLFKDVRSVAGVLGFSNDEIVYITSKPYAFVYMYDQWIKREGRKATLRQLQRACLENGRPDAAELVEKAIQATYKLDPKVVLKEEERYFSTLQRSISCATLYSMGNDVANIQHAQERNARSGREITTPSSLAPVRLRPDNDLPPDVFVVYYPEDDRHIRNVVKFVKRLRKEGVDASCDLFMPQSGDDQERGFYIYSKLLESQYVFVVCSSTFHQFCQLQACDNTDEKGKEASFIMSMILKEIYGKGGINAKYIPILFGHDTEEVIPSILKCSTMYKMPHALDELVRRVYKMEKYKLAPMPKTRPVIKPKVIGGGNGLLRGLFKR